jgi:hypothetical protein
MLITGKEKLLFLELIYGKLLDDNPSLKSYLENNFDKCYQISPSYPS